MTVRTLAPPVVTLARGVFGMLSIKWTTATLLLVLRGSWGGTSEQSHPRSRWPDLVTVSVPDPQVVARPGPISIEVPARTVYDPDTLTKVRPRFDTLVEKVFVAVGQRVKKGDPLVELRSADLASAKRDFQVKYRAVATRQEARTTFARSWSRPDGRCCAAALGRHPEQRAEEPARLQPRPSTSSRSTRSPTRKSSVLSLSFARSPPMESHWATKRISRS